MTGSLLFVPGFLLPTWLQLVYITRYMINGCYVLTIKPSVQTVHVYVCLFFPVLLKTVQSQIKRQVVLQGNSA